MRIAPNRIHKGILVNTIALSFGVLASSFALAQPDSLGHAPATKNAAGSLVTYSDLPGFLAATADLGTPAFENFEHGFAQYLPSNQFAACVEPVSADSNDACFGHGDLVAGVHIASTNARGVIVFNPGIYDMPDRTIGAWPYRLNAQSYTEIRFDDPPTAVAADVYGFAMGDGAVPTDVVPVEVDAYDGANNLIGSFSVQASAYNVASFAGFTSSIPVARVVFGTHVDYSAGPIDNLRFAGGAGNLVPGVADFGPVVIGDSQSLSVQFTNTGYRPIQVPALAPLAVPFSIEVDACSGVTLAAGESCTMQVAFAPTFEGDQAYSVSMPNGGDIGHFITWLLKGTGIVALGGAR